MTGNRVVWLRPGDTTESFPPIELALTEPDGLLAAGGDLATARLLQAYRHGIFPWYEEGQPLLWWSPDPRCVLQQGDFHVSRSLGRDLKRSAYSVRFNTAFAAVIRACAAPRRSGPGTWITAEMISAYERLHVEGWAHSIEIWRNHDLVGGLYGVAIGRAFFAESMYSGADGASKIAVLTLARMMDDGALGIVDCQLDSSHLRSLGATLIPRPAFAGILDSLCEPPIRFENWPDAPISTGELLQE